MDFNHMLLLFKGSFVEKKTRNAQTCADENKGEERETGR